MSTRMLRATPRLPGHLRQQLRALRAPPPRLRESLECAMSVALAIILAHWLHAQNVSWAAFTGYLVMRSQLTESLLRGALRVAGTSIGAALALVAVPAMGHSILQLSLSAGLVGGAVLYGALTRKHAYAWLLAGITFEMVLLDSTAHPAGSITAFAATRLLDVGVGTVASLIVNCVSHASARRLWPSEPPASAQILCRRPHLAARHAGQGALALAVLPGLWDWLRLPELSQSAVTILAVMMVPITDHGTGEHEAVGRRLAHRIAGCLAGAVVGGSVLLLSWTSPAVLIACTAAGVVIGRHLESGRGRFAYTGVQFTLAILVTLVPDSYSAIEIGPGADRLFGIVVGMIALAPVMVSWRLLMFAVGFRWNSASPGTAYGRASPRQ